MATGEVTASNVPGSGRNVPLKFGWRMPMWDPLGAPAPSWLPGVRTNLDALSRSDWRRAVGSRTAFSILSPAWIWVIRCHGKFRLPHGSMIFTLNFSAADLEGRSTQLAAVYGLCLR